jgi:hypothetical protein
MQRARRFYPESYQQFQQSGVNMEKSIGVRRAANNASISRLREAQRQFFAG